MPDGKIVHVVDDDEEVCSSTALSLRMEGLECLWWTSASSFLQSADIGCEGCVILDLRMPGKDGFDVQRELAERGSPLHVIMVSGHGDVAIERKAIEAGAFDFLEKPYHPGILIKKVKQALST